MGLRERRELPDDFGVLGGNQNGSRCNIANLAFFSRGLRLNHHQLDAAVALSAPCLMLSYVRHSLTLKRYSRNFYFLFTLLPKQSNRQGGDTDLARPGVAPPLVLRGVI